MNLKDAAREWANFATASLTERGRLDALAAALHESPEVLKETLRLLKLESVEDVLRWAWKAEKADRSWMRKEAV